MNITEILQQHGERFPNEVAIIDRRGRRVRHTTHAEFNTAIDRTSCFLRRSGLKMGDTVLVFHPMSAELYIILGAVLRSGMTAMFVDPSAGRGYIDRCCELIPPQALIASSKAHLLRLLSPRLRRIRNKWSVGRRLPWTQCIAPFADEEAEMEQDRQIHDCDPETPALVSFTSGTTGEPKAAVRTHGFLLAQHHAVDTSLTLLPREVELVTMPIFVLANLASRVTSVIADTDLRRVAEISPLPVIRQIHEHRIDRITAAPALLERIVNCCEQQGLSLHCLRKIFTGGGPVPPRLLDRLQAVAPEAEITAVYGSTEAEPICTMKRCELQAEDISAIDRGNGLLVGSPVESIEVRIMRDSWGTPLGRMTSDQFLRQCRSAGQPGEIVVSGAHVLPGYLNGSASEENKFHVDRTPWHRTGDAGYFDAQGRLWLLGRCAARVSDERGALYPLGVEQAAMQNAAIGQAAMISHGGKRVLAVTLRDNCQPNFPSLLKSLSFASVDSIRIVKRLPVDRRHQSKIDYASLRRLLER